MGWNSLCHNRLLECNCFIGSYCPKYGEVKGAFLGALIMMPFPRTLHIGIVNCSNKCKYIL